MIKDLPLMIEEIENFVLNEKVERNKWIYFPNGKLYIRIGPKFFDGQIIHTLQVATVEAVRMRKGFFSDIITATETIAQKHGLAVFVENCMYDFLWSHLEKRGYTQEGNKENSCLSFYKI